MAAGPRPPNPKPPPPTPPPSARDSFARSLSPSAPPSAARTGGRRRSDGQFAGDPLDSRLRQRHGPGAAVRGHAPVAAGLGLRQLRREPGPPRPVADPARDHPGLAPRGERRADDALLGP